MRRIILVLLVLKVIAVISGAPCRALQEALVSPRLVALQSEINSQKSGALEKFWAEISNRGAPLIETIEGDDRNLLVTFLWRAGRETTNVVVFSELGGLENISRNMMTRLGDSDLWYKSYRVRNDARFTYYLSPDDSLLPIKTVTDWAQRTRTWQTDPLNPNRYLSPIKSVASTVELPSAPHQPWVERQSGLSSGRLEVKSLKSTILNNERKVWVYTPAGYAQDAEPYNLLVLFDGVFYTIFIPTPVILDNMIAKRSIPPMVAVVIDTLFDRVRELSCYPPFNEFLSKELVPWIRQNYNVTSDPRRTIIGGSSLAGLAAVFAGLQHPEIFGNVISQSGSFWWKPSKAIEHEWLTRQYVTRSQLSLRFYLDVGLFEQGPTPDDGPSMLIVNRHLRDVLQAKGYSVHYQEFNGGHEFFNWRGTLSDGLMALVGNSTKGK